MNQPTDLEQLVVHHVAPRLDVPAGGELRLVVDRPLVDDGPGARTLADLLGLLAAARDVVGAAAPLRWQDLVLPEQDATGDVDADEVRARAEALAAAAGAAASALRVAVDASSPERDQLVAALVGASRVGARGAVPAAAATAAELHDQAAALVGPLGEAGDRAAALLATTGPDGAALVDRATAAIEAVLGPDVPVLPVTRLDDPAAVAGSLADRAALLAGDDLAPTTWLARRALVRPAVDRLQRVLVAAELCGSATGVDDLVLAQLPHVPGDRWVAAPLPEDRVLPDGRLAIVTHAPDGLDPAAPLAGLVVDDWGERIPSPVETTGVALHADAPGSRAPQTILLAMPGDAGQQRWTVEALRDTVVEAAAMARIRAVEPQHVWLAGRVLPALYVAHNVARDTTSVDLADLQVRHGGAWGTNGTRTEGT